MREVRTPNMARPLDVGDVIHGFAHGAFGRDHYNCVRVEAVGPDWIVARDPDCSGREPSFTSGRRSLELCIQARDESCPDGCSMQNERPLTSYGHATER
jgi:hypothetical protein